MKRALLPAAAAVLALASACSGTPVSRSGASTEPITLRSEWGQDPLGVGGDVLVALIRSTANGPVTVAEGPRAANPAPSNREVDAVKKLMSGAADVTVVRAGAVQLLGGVSIAPLGAPLVVTNNDQADAIAADPSIREAVLADLDEMGLVGLALVPGGLRHPFGYGTEPLLGAADYDGESVNARRDAGVALILSRLGAQPDYSDQAERSARAKSGRLRGIEVSVQQSQAVDLPAVQTANVTLYEKFDIVLVRKAAWDGISAAQQQALRASVADAVEAVRSARPTEAVGQARWCRAPGASTVLATAAELASLHSVLDPLTDAMAEDAAAAGVLERMRTLHDGTTDPAPAACEAPPPVDARSEYLVEPKGDQGVLDGTWRLAVSEKYLLSRGVSGQDARANAGVWEFRFKGGRADIDQPDGRPCNAAYAVDKNRISVEWGVEGVDECGGLMSGTWRIDGDRLNIAVRKEMEYDVRLDKAMFEPGMVRVK